MATLRAVCATHSEAHWKLLEEHGWTKCFDVDLMDAEGPDVVWPVPAERF